MLARQRAIFPDTAENALKEEFFGRAQTGYFVDVGANDPKDMSQTWHLERPAGAASSSNRSPGASRRGSENNGKPKYLPCACSSPANAGKYAAVACAAGMHSR